MERADVESTKWKEMWMESPIKTDLPSLYLEFDTLQQAYLDRVERSGFGKVIIRCQKAPKLTTIENFPNVKLLIFECKMPVSMILRNMPSLEMAFTLGVTGLDVNLDQDLSSFEIGGIKPRARDTRMTIPATSSFVVRNGVVPNCAFQRPESIRELSFYKIAEQLAVREWWLACDKLERLDVFRARGFDSKGIEHFQTLKRLDLLDVGELPNIDFLRLLPNLESLNLGGSTIVRSGDLSPLRELPKLAYVLFSNRKHYNMRMREYDGRMESLVDLA